MSIVACVLQTSVTVLLTGAYLFIVGVLAQIVVRFGGTASFPIDALSSSLGSYPSRVASF